MHALVHGLEQKWTIRSFGALVGRKGSRRRTVISAGSGDWESIEGHLQTIPLDHLGIAPKLVLPRVSLLKFLGRLNLG